MPQALVVVYTAGNPGLAEIIQSALQAAGIPAQTSREGAGKVYGITVGPLAMVDILVPEDHAAQAEALLDAMRRGDLADDSDEIDTRADPDATDDGPALG
jgi:hypothetical protein